MKALQQNQPQANGITVDDGSERVPVLNKKGEEIGVFYMRPTDVGIIDRCNTVAKEFEKITAPLEHIDIRADGTADETDEAAVHALKEAEANLYRACDYLFGGEMSEAFFGKMNPFSPINGHFYCENALSAVTQYISARFDTEIQKINGRVEKYTGAYRKGGKK